MPGVAARVRRNGFGRALRHHHAATRAAFGPHVDHPVRGLDDIQVMFDDDDGVALIDKCLEDLQQFTDIVKMEPRRGFIQDLDGLAGSSFGQFF